MPDNQTIADRYVNLKMAAHEIQRALECLMQPDTDLQIRIDGSKAYEESAVKLITNNIYSLQETGIK